MIDKLTIDACKNEHPAKSGHSSNRFDSLGSNTFRGLNTTQGTWTSYLNIFNMCTNFLLGRSFMQVLSTMALESIPFSAFVLYCVGLLRLCDLMVGRSYN